MAANTTASTAGGPKAKSLHIGLNAVHGPDYSGWTGELSACEFDAKDMAALASSQGMEATLMLTREATRSKVLGSIRAAAKSLASGDLFFLTYSGHGGQVPDVTGEEADKRDETWCLYDGQLIDDELYAELTRFGAGVRILVLSDSCHSGTVVRAGPPQPGAAGERPRMMPPAVAEQVYDAHQAFYDGLQQEVAEAFGKAAVDPDTALANVGVSPRLSSIARRCKARVILISGCQDNQTSMDGPRNGAYTGQLLAVWNRGAFQGNYAKFHKRIVGGMPPSQTPNLFTLGSAGLFLDQRPFTV